jgi:hypothetical protein
MDYQQRINRRASAHRMAGGLGWFSIGLGLVELVCARGLARALGMQGREGVIRLYGVREVATGVGILVAKDREPWIWGRVAGDGLDLATLGAEFRGNPQSRNLALAIGAVTGATALDVMTAQALAKVERLARAPARDYGDRSGLPLGVEASRGIARADFEMPPDMRAPDALRPLH